MSAHRTVPRPIPRTASAVLVSLTVMGGLLVAAAPAQADDDLVRVSRWCNKTVTFSNLTSKKVKVSYRAGVPISPFPSQQGAFTLKPYDFYVLKAPGSKHYGDEGTTHRLYWEARQGEDDQDGYVKQWRKCGGLVATSAKCGYVTFTNISPYRVWISLRDQDDYFYWDDEFKLKSGRSKTVEFRARALEWIAERRSDDGYKRQSGTVFMPKKCKYYEDDDDDDDDDKYDPDFVGEFILNLFPGARPQVRDVKPVPVRN